MDKTHAHFFTGTENPPHPTKNCVRPGGSDRPARRSAAARPSPRGEATCGAGAREGPGAEAAQPRPPTPRRVRAGHAARRGASCEQSWAGRAPGSLGPRPGERGGRRRDPQTFFCPCVRGGRAHLSPPRSRSGPIVRGPRPLRRQLADPLAAPGDPTRRGAPPGAGCALGHRDGVVGGRLVLPGGTDASLYGETKPRTPPSRTPREPRRLRARTRR